MKYKYKNIELPNDFDNIKEISALAFSSTPDSSLNQWFSFSEMKRVIAREKGMCIKAVDNKEKIVGIIYAQQESPINNKEGEEKWVILMSAVHSELVGEGIGTGLLNVIEKYAKDKGAIKMFVYTNKEDKKVISFYKKNGYEDAGWIRDYQYGKNNSAVFLLKYLSE